MLAANLQNNCGNVKDDVAQYENEVKEELMKQKGTGVGLYTSWRIVQLHGSKIEADSKQGEWAEFAVRIPQPLPTEVE